MAAGAALPTLSVAERLLFNRIDGERSVQQLRELFGAHRDTLSVMESLISKGLVDVSTPHRGPLVSEPAPVTPEAPPVAPEDSPPPAAQEAHEAVLAPQDAPTTVSAGPVLPQPLMDSFARGLTAQVGPVARLLIRDALKACGASDGLVVSEIRTFGTQLLLISPESRHAEISLLLDALVTQAQQDA